MARAKSSSKLPAAERAELEARLHELQSEVLTGELRGLERRRQQLVDLGFFEPTESARSFDPAEPTRPSPPEKPADPAPAARSKRGG